jgi:hypothetical protein
MIYANLPVKCRFIPIDINDEVFVTVFLAYFSIFLEAASNSLISVVDNDDGRYDDFSENDILYYAKWAKDVYAVKERVKEENPIQYCERTKYRRRIIRTVSPYHIGFELDNHSTENINYGIRLYNSL